MGILKHDSQRAAQIRLFDLIDIDIVIADFSVRDIVKPVDQVRNRGLARACSTYKGNLLSRLRVQRNMMQHNLVFRVAEIHVVEHHASFQLPVRNCSVRLVRMLPGPQICAFRGFCQTAVFIFLYIHQLHIAFILLRLLIHQIKYTLGSGRRVYHEVDLLAYLGNRVCEALIQSHEGNDSTYGHTGQAVDTENGSHDGHQRVADPADIGVYGHQQVCVAVGLICAVPKLLIYLMKVIHGFLFMAEDLDHLLAVQHFLDKAVYRAQVNLLADVIFSGQSRKGRGHQKHDHSRQNGNNRQHGIQKYHGDKSRRHGDDRVDNLGNTLAQQLPQSIHIIGIDGHDIAVGVGIKIFDGKRFHSPEQIVS